jgi:hypothetical protein
MRVVLQYKPDEVRIIIIIINEAAKNLLSWCLCVVLVLVTPRRLHLGAETCSSFLRLIYELYLVVCICWWIWLIKGVTHGMYNIKLPGTCASCHSRILEYYNAGLRRFSKNLGATSKIPGSGRTTWSTFHTEDSQILGAAVKSLVTRANWCPEFVQPYSTAQCGVPTVWT